MAIVILERSWLWMQSSHVYIYPYFSTNELHKNSKERIEGSWNTGYGKLGNLAREY